MRPEIIGLVLGAFILSVATGEFKAKAGSSPATRFVLGGFVMIGALAFLGCPLRMVIRLGGGDLNALVALAGFVCGILCGVFFLNRGYSLKRAYPVGKAEGGVLPVIMAGLLILALAVPALFKSSTEGPGSMRAPVIAALLIAAVVGALAQRARLCMAGRPARRVPVPRLQAALRLCGDLRRGAGGQSHKRHVQAGASSCSRCRTARICGTSWAWRSLATVRVLLGGCPLRQLILAGDGNGDSAVTVLGMMAGAAISHNFGLAGTLTRSRGGVSMVDRRHLYGG